MTVGRRSERSGAVRVAVVVALAAMAGPGGVAGQVGEVLAPLPEVERRGTGDRSLLLIPCAACGWWSFDGFMERNADRYRMMAVTLPGYGATVEPDIPSDTDGAPWHANAVAALSRLLDEEGWDDVVVVGHSFGSVIALELAARRPDVVTGVVNLDGGISSNRSWFPEDPAARGPAADELTEGNRARYADPMAWRALNLPTILDPERRFLYHGMFMGSSRNATFQYWRENMIVDLNPMLAGLEIPVLDLQAVAPTAADPAASRDAYLASMREDGAPPSLRTVWAFETFHHLLEHRPALVDSMIATWLAGGVPSDFAPDGWDAPGPAAPGGTVTASRARRYTGRYDTVLGTYAITHADGALVLEREGATVPLVHVRGDVFARSDNPRLTFEFDAPDGRAVSFRHRSPGGGLDLLGTARPAPGLRGG